MVSRAILKNEEICKTTTKGAVGLFMCVCACLFYVLSRGT